MTQFSTCKVTILLAKPIHLPRNRIEMLTRQLDVVLVIVVVLSNLSVCLELFSMLLLLLSSFQRAIILARYHPYYLTIITAKILKSSSC